MSETGLKLLVFVDAQGRYLGTLWGPEKINYKKVFEWARAERGITLPHELLEVLRADKRFWSYQTKLVRIE